MCFVKLCVNLIVLKVSFYDGVIALYDVNSTEKGPLMDSKYVLNYAVCGYRLIAYLALGAVLIDQLNNLKSL